MRKLSLILPLLLAACSPAAEQSTANPAPASPAPKPAPLPAPPAAAPAPPVEPPAPGTPGGLPDDRAPLDETPAAQASPQAAATVVETYYALLEARRYAEAWKLWSGGGQASGMDPAAFAASFDKYAEYHAQVGAPGAMEGAAGSSYVEVPVVIYGRTKSGEPVHMEGPVTLRRVNDVPGSTPEQRRWHIASSGVKPRPSGQPTG